MTKATAGETLIASVLADMSQQHLRPDARETEILERARAAADRIAELEAIVMVEGITFSDTAGTVRPNPLLAEIRSTTLVLARLLGSIQMSVLAQSKNPVKQRAGQASWTARSRRQGLADRSGSA